MTLEQRDPGASALLTDLYQLTMLQTYYEHGMTRDAQCSSCSSGGCRPSSAISCWRPDSSRSWSSSKVCSFAPMSSSGLARQNRFTAQFIDQLARLRFTGDVDAIPEGTVFFANEPVVRIVAPLPQAQLVETRLMNLVHFQTMIASKAARAAIAGARASCWWISDCAARTARRPACWPRARPTWPG